MGQSTRSRTSRQVSRFQKQVALAKQRMAERPLLFESLFSQELIREVLSPRGVGFSRSTSTTGASQSDRHSPHSGDDAVMRKCMTLPAATIDGKFTVYTREAEHLILDRAGYILPAATIDGKFTVYTREAESLILDRAGDILPAVWFEGLFTSIPARPKVSFWTARGIAYVQQPILFL